MYRYAYRVHPCPQFREYYRQSGSHYESLTPFLSQINFLVTRSIYF